MKESRKEVPNSQERIIISGTPEERKTRIKALKENGWAVFGEEYNESLPKENQLGVIMKKQEKKVEKE